MKDFEIKIDKDGLWYYNGAHMFRKEILKVFFQSMRMDACGQYWIEMGAERCPLMVEDAPFVVTAVYKTKSPKETIDIVLSDDSCESLEMTSLHIGQGNVLYCRVKNGMFPARFLRKSYYQLAEFIEPSEENGVFCITLNNHQYFIKENFIS